MKIPSRATRFSDAFDKISNGKMDIEDLRDELQSWLDGMPENLQSGSKAEALQEAIDNLENIISNLEEAEGTEVEFPGMFY